MKPLAALFLAGFVLFISSCSKDPRPNEGTKLAMIKMESKGQPLRYQTYRASGPSTLVVQDSLSASTEKLFLEYGPNGLSSVALSNTAGPGPLFTLVLDYNAGGKIIKRRTIPGTLNVADDYEIYTYDAAGHMVSDSQFTKNLSTSIYQCVHVAKFMYTGNNVTEAEMYDNPTGSGFHLLNRVKYEYDNGLNPYKFFGSFYHAVSNQADIYSAYYISENNVIKTWFAEGNAAYQLGLTYSYQYNSSNYPWKMKNTAVNLTGVIEGETEFFYNP